MIRVMQCPLQPPAAAAVHISSGSSFTFRYWIKKKKPTHYSPVLTLTSWGGEMWVLFICVSRYHLEPQLFSPSSTFFLFFSLFVGLQSRLLVNISSFYRSNSLFSENTFWSNVNTTFVSFLDPWKYSSRDLTDYLLLNPPKALKLQNE